MAEFRKLYKLVNFVHNENYRTTKDFDLGRLQTQEAIGVNYVSESVCLSFLVYDCKLSNKKAHETLESALSEEHGYLIAYRGAAGAGRNLGVTAGKGMDFVTKIGPFRAGMCRDFLRHYTSYTVIISLLALVISVVAIVVSIVIRKGQHG